MSIDHVKNHSFFLKLINKLYLTGKNIVEWSVIAIGLFIALIALWLVYEVQDRTEKYSNHVKKYPS